jgi:hypothetical protein
MFRNSFHRSKRVLSSIRWRFICLILAYVSISVYLDVHATEHVFTNSKDSVHCERCAMAAQISNTVVSDVFAWPEIFHSKTSFNSQLPSLHSQISFEAYLTRAPPIFL